MNMYSSNRSCSRLYIIIIIIKGIYIAQVRKGHKCANVHGVCVCVCHCISVTVVTTARCANMAEPIKMQFGQRAQLGPMY